MNISTKFRLPDSEYFKSPCEKMHITLHHTVGGSAESTFRYWVNDPGRIGTATIIERDGTIYEIFEPFYWCHHLGLKSDLNQALNRTSIGIEMASEGALLSGSELNQKKETTKYNTQKLYAFDGARCLYDLSENDKYVDLGHAWRGYRYFDAYDPLQLATLFEYILHLIKEFNIPRHIFTQDSNTPIDLHELVATGGIYGHSQVRSDKTDVHPLFPWKQLAETLIQDRVILQG